MIEWFVAFHRPAFRNHAGKIDPRCWFGHCDIYGYDDDQTWVFIDPMGDGARVTAPYKHDDVMLDLWAKNEQAYLILRMKPRKFRLPFHGLLTCASVCGMFLGIRAFLPSGLRRKMLRLGAEIVHESKGPKGRSG